MSIVKHVLRLTTAEDEVRCCGEGTGQTFHNGFFEMLNFTRGQRSWEKPGGKGLKLKTSNLDQISTIVISEV